MDDTELCINLWFCFDKETGFVDALAGRGYFLSGTDDDKNAVLKALAGSDYLNVQWQSVPDNYKTSLVGPESNQTETFSGVIHAKEIDALGMGVFEDVFKKIESINQPYLPVKNAMEVKVSDNLLYVCTPVEKFQGGVRVVC